MTRREVIVPSPVAGLLELLAAPDVNELVARVEDPALRQLYARLLGRLHQLRETEVRP